MYTDLREFELAKKSMTSADQDTKDLMTKQADWAMNTNDQNTAWYVWHSHSRRLMKYLEDTTSMYCIGACSNLQAF